MYMRHWTVKTISNGKNKKEEKKHGELSSEGVKSSRSSAKGELQEWTKKLCPKASEKEKGRRHGAGGIKTCAD